MEIQLPPSAAQDRPQKPRMIERPAEVARERATLLPTDSTKVSFGRPTGRAGPRLVVGRAGCG